jgi:hypothetical protein
VGRIVVVVVAIDLITTILVSTVSRVHIIYEQNITTTPVTNYTSITMPSIAEMNSTTIINAKMLKLS